MLVVDVRLAVVGVELGGQESALEAVDLVADTVGLLQIRGAVHPRVLEIAVSHAPGRVYGGGGKRAGAGQGGLGFHG